MKTTKMTGTAVEVAKLNVHDAFERLVVAPTREETAELKVRFEKMFANDMASALRWMSADLIELDVRMKEAESVFEFLAERTEDEAVGILRDIVEQTERRHIGRLGADLPKSEEEITRRKVEGWLYNKVKMVLECI